MRILVTGGRRYGNLFAVERALIEAAQGSTVRPTVVSGGATGADRLATDVALRLGWRIEVISADWRSCGPDCPTSPYHRPTIRTGSYCPGAGPRRNQAMVDGGADICLAFPGGSGTADCVSRARAAGIPVRMVSDLCPASCTSAPVAAPSAAAISGSRQPGSSSSTGGRPTVPARKPSHRRGRTP